MESRIKIDNKEYKTLLTGRTFRIYREKFNKDLLSEIEEANYRYNSTMKAIVNGETELDIDSDDIATTSGILGYKNIGDELLTTLVWACIKAHKSNKKVKDYEAWVDDIEDYFGFISEALLLFFAIVNSTRPQVEYEDDEDSEEDSEKKKES